MLYNLIKKKNGKEIVDSTNTLPIVKQRLKTLRSSLRGQKVEFIIRPTDDNEKYQKPCDSRHY